MGRGRVKQAEFRGACTAAGLFAPVSAYLVLANPAGPVDGYACRIDVTGAAYMLQGQSGSGMDADAATLGYQVTGFSAPLTGGNLVLRTFSLMLTAPGEVDFLIGPPNIPVVLPNDLPCIHRNGAWLRCGVSSGGVTRPVAVINGACPVPGEVESFGAVKTLFR